MEEEDVNDLFKDFEGKVSGKEEKVKEYKENVNEEGLLKDRYKKAEIALKEKYRKEKDALEREKAKEMVIKHGKIPTKKLDKIERYAYIAVIIVLVVYIIIDLSFYHGGKDVELESKQEIPAVISGTAEEGNETAEVQEEPVIEETESPPEEETSVEEEEQEELPGVITLNIDQIYDDVAENLEDVGYITKVVFTVYNGKDKVLTPVVNVYAYDDNNKEDYETRSRGEYTYLAGIPAGKEHTGSIDLLPKTWIDLDLEKTIRITLNDTKEGYITAIRKTILIS